MKYLLSLVFYISIFPLYATQRTPLVAVILEKIAQAGRAVIVTEFKKRAEKYKEGDQYQHGMSLMHIAVKMQNEKILADLVRAGYDVNAADQWGNTPLHYAYYNHRDNTVRILIELGADKCLRNMYGRKPSYLQRIKCRR